jgi:hypothetical protein
MSCRKHGHDDDNCVCAVLRNIADVQDQVDPAVDDDCVVSCERSIEELLSPVTTPPNANNTIPVILYCDCAPFQGFGVKKVQGKFTCFKSFVFKVKSVDDDCCAVLELLETEDHKNKGGHYPPQPIVEDPCDQFPAEGFVGTGICITVDLSCFCAVTCLEPTFV